MQKVALGKGLGALIPDLSTLDDKEKKALGIIEVDLDKIAPNEYQPRKVFDDGKLKELAASIKEQGVIQPIIVHRAGNGYGLIAVEHGQSGNTLAERHRGPWGKTSLSVAQQNRDAAAGGGAVEHQEVVPAVMIHVR